MLSCRDGHCAVNIQPQTSRPHGGHYTALHSPRQTPGCGGRTGVIQLRRLTRYQCVCGTFYLLNAKRFHLLVQRNLATRHAKEDSSLSVSGITIIEYGTVTPQTHMTVLDASAKCFLNFRCAALSGSNSYTFFTQANIGKGR